MSISGIEQSTLMSPLYAMQQQSSSDIASNIFDVIDINGDNLLSTEEIGQSGEQAQNILGADTDDDDVITMDELISDITNKMNSGDMPPPPPPPDGAESQSDTAQNIMNELDTDSDNTLSTEEINTGGNQAQDILNADTNGDGIVTMSELLAYLEEQNQFDETEQDNSDLTTLALNQYNDSLTTIEMLTSSNLSIVA